MDNNVATIFDIQRYSIHDGPGIRTLVFFKGCSLRCAWCQNPESLDKECEIAFTASKCIGCGECAISCPKGAITYDDPKRIKRSLCDRCGKCAEICYAEALTRIGKKYDVRALLDVVERDRPFYERSGGGITVSGGEPTLQFDFLFNFLRAAKEAGLNTVIETCGAFAWSKFKSLLPYLDLVYFDLKVIIEDEHERLTGVSNRRILANARKMAESGKNVVFRVPLVPGMTTTEKNLADLIGVLRSFEQQEVHLLPYHSMGESKLERIGHPMKPLGLTPLTEDQIASIKAKFELAGFRVSIGGS